MLAIGWTAPPERAPGGASIRRRRAARPRAGRRARSARPARTDPARSSSARGRSRRARARCRRPTRPSGCRSALRTRCPRARRPEARAQPERIRARGPWRCRRRGWRRRERCRPGGGAARVFRARAEAVLELARVPSVAGRADGGGRCRARWRSSAKTRRSSTRMRSRMPNAITSATIAKIGSARTASPIITISDMGRPPESSPRSMLGQPQPERNGPRELILGGQGLVTARGRKVRADAAATAS